jgi:hypothetical protein
MILVETPNLLPNHLVWGSEGFPVPNEERREHRGESTKSACIYRKARHLLVAGRGQASLFSGIIRIPEIRLISGILKS